MFLRKATILGLMTVLVLGKAAPVMAAPGDSKEDLKAAMKVLASNVQKLLAEEKQEAIAIGEFTGPAQLDSNFGPGLKRMLSEELQALKVTMSRTANLQIKGRYASVPDPSDKDQIAMRLTVEVLDSTDERRGEFKADVRSNTDIAKLSGTTTSLPPKGDKEVRNEKLQDAIKSPRVHIEGALIKTRPESPFAVEVLVKGKPRQPGQNVGEAFVNIQRDEIYEVRVHNRSANEAAVSLTIDGLDVFTFSDVKDEKTGKPLYSHFIVQPKSTFTILGWHKTNDKALSFLVTEYGKGASSQLKSTGPVGVLTAAFSACSLHPNDLPADDGARSLPQNETGKGPPRDTKLKEVTRTIGVVRDIISVRYTR